MTRYAVLLRGINVGGHNKLPMPRLKDIAAAVGLTDAETYVQSGNLAVTSATSATAVNTLLRKGIRDETGLDLPLVLRTHAELTKVVDACPYDVPDKPSNLHVVFFEAKVADPEVDPGDEAYSCHGREVYALYPRGQGVSKLAPVLARKLPGGTDRNWNTVLKLVEMTAN